MDSDTFYETAKTYLDNCDKGAVVTTIPAGSGVFHIANVAPDRFDAAWISLNPGRFSDSGEKARYYADEFDVCAREIGYPPGSYPSDAVFVAAELKESIDVIDVYKLPADIQSELFIDRMPGTKWEKSHQLMKAVREDKRFAETRGILYPSASGQMLGTGGSCLALTCEPIPTNIIGSGDYVWLKSQYSVS